MFVRLTQLDGRSIWVNPRYLVTIEARKGGGSLVVPMGDGFDYEVREHPDTILGLCDGTVMQDDIIPPKEPVLASMELPSSQDVVSGSTPAEAKEADVGTKARTRTTRRQSKSSTSALDAGAKPAAKGRKRTSRKKPAIDLTDEQLDRLRKMAPGSRRKLINTLVHLKVLDPEHVLEALEANGIIELMPDNHVNWIGATKEDKQVGT